MEDARISAKKTNNLPVFALESLPNANMGLPGGGLFALTYPSDPGVKRIVLILDACLVVAVRAVPVGESLGRVRGHMDVQGILPTVRARRRNVLRSGNHNWSSSY